MTTTTPTIPAESVQTVIDAILAELGKPITETHTAALEAFRRGDDSTIRVLAASNLADSYCRSLGYLISAPKLLPTTPVILAEAARAAADHRRDLSLETLSQTIAAAFG
ncbi:MAG: hypothetical protein EA368_12360 [Leptolyngbya sp. DLM2.Bin27]|nr:MAG: hypothetical protein EA368_12360 [Leptolyngbya sp. DLM2.Bin27]